MEYAYSGIVFNLEQGENSGTCYNMKEPCPGLKGGEDGVLFNWYRVPNLQDEKFLETGYKIM